ncbi:hypothetical protein [Ancylobacter rudongensis]|uniref:hypothetical protein n=1 Tax=Ancylobacter rudongensis TaxID=177413 RepID=UPI0013BEA933|nr:hypothetical protein [Ancylobacter rudongensis]
MDSIQFDAREPARIHLFADFGAQTAAYTIPRFACVRVQPCPRTSACRHAGELGFARGFDAIFEHIGSALFMRLLGHTRAMPSRRIAGATERATGSSV